MNIQKLIAVSFAALLGSNMPSVAHPISQEAPKSTNEKVVFLKYGNLDEWITRNIEESFLIGGHTRTIYAIAPTETWNNDDPYLGKGGSPWGTSNVLARVSGITKTNLSVYKEERPGNGFCAKLMTHVETCKVLGLVNIKVLAAGSIFLGQMQEPITGTKNPMGKMDAGIKFNQRPKSLCFDYKIKLSGEPNRIRQTGFSRVTTVEGIDMPDCIMYLQKRWEDGEGNIFAKRVGTMVKRFDKSTNGWVNDARFDIHYGNITKEPFYKDYMGLTKGDDTKYAKNSKGKMVPIQEIGWADENEAPTHMVLQFDSSHGGAYIGSIGNTFWVDNIRIVLE